MVNPEVLVISSDLADKIIGTMDAVMPQLPPEVRKRLNRIKMRYWQLHGIEGLYKRVNNRTVAVILAEYDGDDPKPAASGQVDDVRYDLFDPPDRADQDKDENGK